MTQRIGIADYHVPEEILQAANFATQPLTDALDGTGAGAHYLPAQTCLYCTSAEQILNRHESNPFDGVVFASTCTAMEKLYEVYCRKGSMGFVDIVDFPKVRNSTSVHFFCQRLKMLAKKIEDRFDLRITRAALQDSIRLNNSLRKALSEKQLNRADLFKNQPVSAANIRQKIHLVNESPPRQDAALPRVLVVGSKVQEDIVGKCIRQEKGSAVRFITDHGSKYNAVRVEENDNDPYEALARAYLDVSGPGRINHDFLDISTTRESVSEERIDGIITLSYPFCAKMVYDTAWLRKNSDTLGVPILHIQLSDVHTIAAGQRNRIASFLETIEGRA